MIGARLIVNADDYGLTAGVSAGIRHAHQHGIVTTTTAMMNAPEAAAEVGRALRECPGLGLGIHLVLSAGRPLRPPQRVPTLVDAAGRLRDRAAYPEAYAGVDSRELRDEWTAQVEAFCATGAVPDHLDCHHHVGYLHETGMKVVLDLAAELRVPIRPVEAVLARGSGSGGHAVNGRPVLPWLRLAVRLERMAERSGVARPDRVIGSFGGARRDETALLEALEDLGHGTTELVAHPGFADEALLRGSRYAREREDELRALTSARVRARLVERGVRLVTFRGAGLRPGGPAR